MSSKKRTAARAAARRAARSGQRSRGSSSASHGQTQSRIAKAWKAASANPLVVAALAAAISILASLLIADYLHQRTANDAAIQAQRDAAAAARSRNAELVDFGLGSATHKSSPQIIIENRSSGWIRNITLYVPVPTRTTHEPDGGVITRIPNFRVYGGVNGDQGVFTSGNGTYFREPMPDIGPCELAVAAALRSVPAINPTTLAKSDLDFTDPDGNAWARFGSGKLVRNTRYKGPGAWQPYALLEPLPGCSPS